MVAVCSKQNIGSNTTQQIRTGRGEFYPDRNQKRDLGKQKASRSYTGGIFKTHVYYVKATMLEKTHILGEINGFVFGFIL